jgi:hypothetical protein
MRKSYNMSLKIIATLITSIAVIFASGCTSPIEGTGPQISKEISIEKFEELNLEIPATVTLVMSDTVQCIIKAQQNIIDVIRFENSGNELEISSDKNFAGDSPIAIFLSTQFIKELTLSGSGTIQSFNPIKTKSIDASLNGSGKISLIAMVDKLMANLNGSGSIILEGTADKSDLRINGSGDIHAQDLITNKSKIEITGSGNASLFATAKLHAEITGSGVIDYKGNPELTSKITGSGEIQKKIK